jgi:hypothetical protein
VPPHGNRRVPLEDRFWTKVRELPNGCWEWGASVSPSGYGVIREGGGGSPSKVAHRVAYEFVVGKIPEGLCIDHLCRNRACVNPAHLEPVTMRENLLRGEGWAGRHARKTHCPSGHPYSGPNLARGSKGERRCRACARDRARRKAAA